jgi:hypothetical protein
MLRGIADLVLTDEALSEGVPGGHSDTHFHLPALDPLDGGIAPWLDDAYGSGARQVLLIGHGAEPLLDQLSYIDEMWVEISRTDSPMALTPTSQTLSEAGFQAVNVIADRAMIIAHLRRTASNL